MSRNAKGKKRDLTAPSTALVPISTLFQQAQALLDELDVGGASQIYKRILRREPNNTVAMDELGELLIQLGDIEDAAAVLQRSIQLDPKSGYSKYMNLGQLIDPEEAVGVYKTGINIMLERLAATQDEAEKKTLLHKITLGYCTIAELYLTDLCFDENAEAECQMFLDLALQNGSQFPEPHQYLASMRISQLKDEEALALLNKSLDMWVPKLQELLAKLQHQNGEEGAARQDDQDDFLPAFDFRVDSAKLLIELNQHARALVVLEQLVQEDEDEIELWYLMGLCQVSLGQHAEALHSLQAAVEIFQVNPPEPDDPLVVKLQVLYADLSQNHPDVVAKLAAETGGDDDDDEDEDEDEDEEDMHVEN